MQSGVSCVGGWNNCKDPSRNNQIMFNTGEKVVCINSDFAPWVHDLYRQLPKKDSVYTIRAVRAGRSDPDFQVDADANIKMTGAEFDILVLLEELVNPDDPHSNVKQELGFKAERFASLLDTTHEDEAWKDEPVETGRELVEK